MNSHEVVSRVEGLCPKKSRREGTTLHPFTRKVLPNGLTVYVKEVHETPIVAVYFWAHTGTANEPEKINGIAHFFEHMFFKGTRQR
ncbi:MAG: insulinase family protein, partial [Candidatus Latescibacteria bacterium]|nr:insulinase family protein [Candidatus Latescibacterota bacterium]